MNSNKCLNLNGMRLPLIQSIRNAIALNETAKINKAAMNIGLSLYTVKNKCLLFLTILRLKTIQISSGRF